MARDNETDFGEDLFEPFELEQRPLDDSAPLSAESPLPPPPVEVQTTPTTGEQPTVRCPSCGALNPAHNRHCEECGARLAKGPLPVAPPPMVRSTPGGRALAVLLGVLAIVVIIALGMQLRGDGDEAAQATQTTTTVTTTAPTVVQTVLQPADVEVSSFFPVGGYEGENLIDDDNTTYWNDNSLRGDGATIVFTFAQPVAITEMELQNITDAVAFKRNYRIKDFQVTVDDLQIELPYTMPDSNEPFRAPLATLETRRLTITVLDTYPGEPVGNQPSFTELGLAEVRFFGSVTE